MSDDTKTHEEEAAKVPALEARNLFAMVVPAPGAPKVDANMRVDELEAKMRQLPPIAIEPRHYFADAMYAREITIPAGTLLTGKIHKTRHVNVISKGSIVVWSENEGVKRITAPFTFVAPPGTRRVGYALEDTVWTTFHGTTETDLEKLEEQLIEKREPVALTEGSPCLG